MGNIVAKRLILAIQAVSYNETETNIKFQTAKLFVTAINCINQYTFFYINNPFLTVSPKIV